MSKFEPYNIVLKDFTGTHTVEYTLDDVFFQKIDSPEVQRGNVKAVVNVRKRGDVFELAFRLDGFILVPCDRCLDDMELPITHRENLLVKMGDKFSEEGETVIIPEAEGAINVAWFLYEFIVLNIPLKHVHAPGMCNKAMISKLKKHIARSADEEEDDNDNALLDLVEGEDDLDN